MSTLRKVASKLLCRPMSRCWTVFFLDPRRLPSITSNTVSTMSSTWCPTPYILDGYYGMVGSGTGPSGVCVPERREDLPDEHALSKQWCSVLPKALLTPHFTKVLHSGKDHGWQSSRVFPSSGQSSWIAGRQYLG